MRLSLWGFQRLAVCLVVAATGCEDKRLVRIPESTDTFTQGAANQTVVNFAQKPALVDVLFVVDGSPSMCEKQQYLAQKFSAFIAQLRQQNLDFQVAVTTTDFDNPSFQGKLVAKAGNPKILTPSTPNLTQVFGENVFAVGLAGAAKSQGLLAGLAAVTEPLASRQNNGLLRPEASLAIVIVSDEDDYSLGDVPPKLTDDYFVKFFTRSIEHLKGSGNEDLVAVSAIVGADAQGVAADCSGSGSTNPGCVYHDKDAHSGARYAAVARATGGLTQSICANDFGPLLSTLAARIGGLTKRYDLTSVPFGQVLDPRTISITATPPGGSSFTIPEDTVNGWSYDPTNQAITFAGTGIPPPRSSVAITYGVLTRAFKLTHAPELESLAVDVTLNGITSHVAPTTNDPTKGWVYDAPSNSVVFGTEQIPPLNSTIDVNYRF